MISLRIRQIMSLALLAFAFFGRNAFMAVGINIPFFEWVGISIALWLFWIAYLWRRRPYERGRLTLPLKIIMLIAGIISGIFIFLLLSGILGR